MSPVVRNLLALMLTILGTLQIAGFVFKNEPLYLFGQALALAPLPVPFRDHNGYENFASYRLYEILYVDGHTETLYGSRELTQLLKGPHRRKIAYMQGIMLMPRISPDLSESVAKYLFCTDTGISLIQSPPIKSITIISMVKTAGLEGWRWERSIRCLV